MSPPKPLIPMPPFRNDPRKGCKDVDPETFYPLTYRESSVFAAKQICEDCPLKVQCGSWAVAVGENHGVWGGLTPDERRVVRKYPYLLK